MTTVLQGTGSPVEIDPSVAEHGLPVIGLCLGQAGTPPTPGERLKIAYRILEAAVRRGVRETEPGSDTRANSVMDDG